MTRAPSTGIKHLPCNRCTRIHDALRRRERGGQLGLVPLAQGVRHVAHGDLEIGARACLQIANQVLDEGVVHEIADRHETGCQHRDRSTRTRRIARGCDRRLSLLQGPLRRDRVPTGGEDPLPEPLVYMMDPDGSNLVVLTDRTLYDLAIERERFSADQRFRVFVKDALRFDGERLPALYFYDYLYNAEEQITRFGSGIAWDPVWSPTHEQITFVSNDSGDDEIWIVNRDGSNLKQLTESNESFNAREIGKDTFIPEVNRRPSWSPDGSQVVFWSNRTGHPQIWVTNADGSNLYSLSTAEHNDWDPVWIKYTDPPRNLIPTGPPGLESRLNPPETPPDNNEGSTNPDSEP